MTLSTSGVLLLFLLSCIALRVACWQQVTQQGPWPEARTGHSAVVWNNRMVLFGGRSTYFVASNLSGVVVPATGDCPSLNNCYGRGTCASNSTCECRDGYNGTMCEQEERETIFDDLWLMDLTSSQTANWIQHAPTASAVDNGLWPPARYYHSAVVINDTMILYGGRGQRCDDFCHDLWEYTFSALDGSGSWVKISQAGPGKRWMHTAVVRGSTMVVFGGARQGELLNDIWFYLFEQVRRWKTVTLSPLAPRPSTRCGHTASLTPSRTDGMFVFGGYTDPGAAFTGNRKTEGSDFFLEDFWLFFFSNNSWTPVLKQGVQVSHRMLHSVAVVEDTTVFFGGYDNNEYHKETFRLNTTTMQFIEHVPHFSLSAPSIRSGASLAYLPGHTSLMLFGGHGAEQSVTLGVTRVEHSFNDLWQLNTSFCPDNCHARGVCEFGYCFCTQGWFGYDCQNALCPGSTCSYDIGGTLQQSCSHCSDRGSCVQGECRCSTLYAGAACTELNCPRNCSLRGTCSLVTTTSATGTSTTEAQCSCAAGFYSDDCALIRCPGDCSGRGTCNGAGTCICDVVEGGRYTDLDCSRFVQE